MGLDEHLRQVARSGMERSKGMGPTGSSLPGLSDWNDSARGTRLFEEIHRIHTVTETE